MLKDKKQTAAESDNILISEISAIDKVGPHHIVLTGKSGQLDESPDGQQVFINDNGAKIENGGPIEKGLYKLKFNVAGVFETIQQMTYIGHSDQFHRYIFSKKP